MGLVHSICPSCQQAVPDARSHRAACPARRPRRDTAATNQRKAQKAQARGLWSGHWKGITQKAKAAAGWRCATCGRHRDELNPNEKLTCHLDPAKEGRHETATVQDVTVECSTCHGGRSRGGRGEVA